MKKILPFKRFFAILKLGAGIASLLCFIWACSETKPLVTLIQFARHPALDSVRMGIEKALKNRHMLPNRVTLKCSQTNGNIPLAVQIARQQAALKPKCMIAIATPAAQAIKSAKESSTLLAFAAVTDPQAAGLDGPNTIGVSDKPPIRELLETILEVFPRLKTIGALYNLGEVNSIVTISELEKVAQDRGVAVKKIGVNAADMIKPALQKCRGEVDVIYLPQDNMVVSALPLIVQETLKNGVPIIDNIPLASNDPKLVNQGVLLALGCDYEKSGEQLGHILADKLQGKTLSEPIQKARFKELRVNLESARILGVTIPENVIQKAKNP